MCSKAITAVVDKIKELGDLGTRVLSSYEAALTNAVLIAVTGGIEQIATIAGYRCPCVDFSQVEVNCTNATVGNLTCSESLNVKYGMALLFAPAFILYILGIGLSTKFWKATTGIENRKFERNRRCDCFKHVCVVMGESMLFPVAWVAVALLDGKFLACALTTIPYEIKKDCSEITPKSSMSKAFKDNETYSETIGWFLICAALAAGFLIYTISRCLFHLSYYHAQYYKFYRHQEDIEMKRQLEIDAKEQAKLNVLRFVQSTRDCRPKEDWDKVSTVYEFHRYEEDEVREGVDHNLDVYSNLDHWVKKGRWLDKMAVNGADDKYAKAVNLQSFETDSLLERPHYQNSQV